MITVSSKAKDYIGQIMTEQKAVPGTFLRVGVKSGGCSGLEYQMNLDATQKDGDQVFEDNGVKVVVDMKSLLYLYGTELDYSGGLNGKGLVFNNPNASGPVAAGKVSPFSPRSTPSWREWREISPGKDGMLKYLADPDVIKSELCRMTVK